MEFSFGDHSLDTDRRELRRGGEIVVLEPQVFDLLVIWCSTRDRVFSKDDLLQAADRVGFGTRRPHQCSAQSARRQ